MLWKTRLHRTWERTEQRVGLWGWIRSSYSFVWTMRQGFPMATVSTNRRTATGLILLWRSQYIIIVHVPGTCNYTFYMYMYMYMTICICFALSCWEIFWIYRRFLWLVYCKCICKWASDIIETFLIVFWSIISPYRRWKDYLICMFDLLITSDLTTVTSFRAFCIFKRYENQSTMSWWLYMYW